MKLTSLSIARPLERVENPLETPLSRDQELQFMGWQANNPDILSEPTRDQAGKLMPASLYDMRGAWLAGAKTTQNPLDGTPHYSDAYKLPGFHEYHPGSGDSYFSTESGLAPRFPGYAGRFVGTDDNGHYIPPKKQLDIEQFYKGYY